MVPDVTKKAILQIKENIDTYHNLVVDVDTFVAQIKEKYRKMAEEEVKELRSHVKEYKEEEKFWTKTLSRYDASVIKEVLGEASDTTVPVEQPESVSDSTDAYTPEGELFVSDPEAEIEVTTETPDESPASELENSEQSDITDETNLPESAEMPTEDDMTGAGSDATSVDDEWPETDVSVEVEEEATPAADIVGEEWPEQPQEW